MDRPVTGNSRRHRADPGWVTLTSIKRGRRFIAGAVCPSCGLQDTLFVDVVSDAGGESRVRACTRCRFSERLEPPLHGDGDPVRIVIPEDPPPKRH
ncbi:MAG: hypothetical protein CMQ05_09385 [Gammaproteobacteria bacterium]|uniref:DNA-binding protein n=1 Tax=OM182 bacterium MED-G24 TaxID=1986255 RepID=A0A2A5WY12_9GAMM|nr:hypothetical protein [Gammaproteobacteria bacterium]PDH41127.1 MAG: hypothetical protein CNE99_02295 [OM182 bacterium MED-G24]RPG27299.1 MAG: hypothetical protein CBC10_001860 [Gammaproteobacteria bacterium TMED50]